MNKTEVDFNLEIIFDGELTEEEAIRQAVTIIEDSIRVKGLARTFNTEVIPL